MVKISDFGARSPRFKSHLRQSKKATRYFQCNTTAYFIGPIRLLQYKSLPHARATGPLPSSLVTVIIAELTKNLYFLGNWLPVMEVIFEHTLLNGNECTKWMMRSEPRQGRSSMSQVQLCQVLSPLSSPRLTLFVRKGGREPALAQEFNESPIRPNMTALSYRRPWTMMGRRS